MGIFDRKQPAPKTFAEALMGDLSWGNEIPTPEPRPELTEKALVLESFTQFVHEKLEEAPAETLSFPGGEIAKKEDPAAMPLKPVFTSREQWASAQSERMGAEVWYALTHGKNPKPLVLFIGESLLPLEEAPAGVRAEFLHCFTPPVAELFQKMVQAMKLSEGEYVLTTLKTFDADKTAEELFEEAHWWQARFVVPLGAQACQALMGARERLATIHGKFFTVPRLIEGSEIAPLFHPSVIATNANMKKSTWTDMQKIMKALGKA